MVIELKEPGRAPRRNQADSQENGGAMLCPVCNVPLLMAERQGVEIDYCPQCRGVWLDRGELDKIIDRSAAELVPPHREPTGYGDGEPPRRNTRDSHGKYEKHSKYGKGKSQRRKSWLSEVFDVFD